MMITAETMRMLENSGLVEDVIIGYLVNNEMEMKGSLSTFNMTVRSMTEKQPDRRRFTETVWGKNGDYDFSTPVHYSRRQFDIVLNIYGDLGDMQDQRDEFVKFLSETVESPGSVLMFSKRKNVVYTDLRLEVGDFKPDDYPKGKWQSTLGITISTAPYFTKDGVQYI